MKQELPMSKAATTQKWFKSLLRDQAGTIAVMTGLVTVPLMLAAGAAIDFVRLNAAQTHVQAALDAGALSGAAAKKVSDAKRVSIAEDIFSANMISGPASGMSVKPHFEVQGEKVVAKAELTVPTALMQIAGIGEIKAESYSEVGILGDKKAEIVMVLDYSGSMEDPVGGKTKYVAMREAAKKLVDDLATSDADKVKFGLVPFSNLVHTTLPGSFVLGGSGLWTGCTQDRKSPFNVSTSTPTFAPETQWNQPLYDAEADQLNYTCKGFTKHKLKMVDLTDNFSSISGQLSAMTPYGYTHIALGVEFGYHMLSPNAPFTNGAKYEDKDTKKFIVLLTDGMQTAGAFGEDDNRTPEEGEKNLATLCKNAKADGITIMSMAFDLTDSGTRQRLQNCATDPKRDFFVVNDPKGLATAFEAVKTAIADDIFISK
jgi:Flp pilus assembly protein TadG